MWALTWKAPALDRMADRYVALDPVRREQMAGAVEQLNARLRSDPLDVGESRAGDYRLAFLPGLQVLFRVDLTARAVEVIDAGPSGR
ncbi:MAG: hypothetical protein K2X82_09640 [Gemmataceae bacterium]|nr:hypothetical protein [Gemmataceae bacterium]